MLRSLEWVVLLGLGASAIWVLVAVLVGFANMLGNTLSSWRAKVAVIYDKFKMEKKWLTPNLPRQAAYRLDMAEYEKSYDGYGKKQADIRVCTLHWAEHRCSAAATDALTSWLRETLVELEAKALHKERERFIETLLEILAKHQEILLGQVPPRLAALPSQHPSPAAPAQ